MKQINLYHTTATLAPFLLALPAKGAVIICPGGGYSGLADHEGEPVARAYNDKGYHAFMLSYRVGDQQNLGTKPLYDACTAIAYVRSQCDTFDIPKDTIAICGFSAGGHLAASTGVYWNQPEFFGGSLAPEDYRPNTTILCYPVISEDYPHQGSFVNLAGENPADFTPFSLEKQVSKETAPAFLWHTAADAGVPVGNSLLFGEALAKHAIPFELHVYPHGPHGMGLANKESGPGRENPYVARWFDLSADWLDARFLK